MTALLVHEWLTEERVHGCLLVDVDVPTGELVVTTVDGSVLLPMAVLESVMERYGKPLEDGVCLDGPELQLGEGRVLRRIRHRGFYDVIARDFLVLERPSQEPLVEMATAISAALLHFARAAARPP
jgi:hypothetical protein